MEIQQFINENSTKALINKHAYLVRLRKREQKRDIIKIFLDEKKTIIWK